ncbi:hypothetical protein A7K93_04350 [Candidatus Methylacidiphilum fumarolicum]|uniref:Uncharacterized protein n=2 Tax=Candidatus Methylacidiphilum fumarolicum TaxID=591154 RepID=I0JZ54_METFB|nr:hypothetical protein [Candidatus Methylacidiphilum fumarolicum]MBW6414679.1 hypothetical protein [Candidatus Methylacidiphilum fumarolicum]TFE70183.1 hypothetical protein A7K73_04725 [Candidatus Methylacidiphilum fumarolicum]TFE74250.1 hypothetical protein A7K93_04350 [Candidatus Methylacidiphilum fumarolicum]TFE75749.1 hypothetical protein A7K72_01030 [Candidatus Methylacidiphilum fumarolicum]TFE75908.1 hypothetical protein A7D33_01235 [Candidatus Methylacidiphilum fumarolicum]
MNTQQMDQEQKLKKPLIFEDLLLFIGISILFLLGLLFSFLYASSMQNKQALAEKKRAEEIRKMRLADQLEAKKKLSSYGWIDKEKRIVHIPIEEAMEKVVKEEASKKPKASGVYLPGIQRPEK